jgi:zinc/manganese transport system substrate-binding protein
MSNPIITRAAAAFALALAFLATAPAPVGAAEMAVASFHPLVTDLARQVGGERVEVVPVVTVDDDPHTFEPSARDLAGLRSARLVLVSGKGMEGAYLSKLRDNLGPGQALVEVGREVPSVTVTAGDLFVCCPAHSQGSIDSHWWHSPSNMQRAARIVADAFAEADPAGAAVYRANAEAARERFADLARWAKRELAAVPRAQRKLVTAHAAFGYFCKEFGFKSVPVQGLTREREPSPKYLAETIGVLREQRVAAVFPEVSANPKVLEEMTKATGAKLGGTLIADGTGSEAAGSFESMLRHNVATIVRALAPER